MGDPLSHPSIGLDHLDVSSQNPGVLIQIGKLPENGNLLLDPHDALALSYRLQMSVFDCREHELDQLRRRP